MLSAWHVRTLLMVLLLYGAVAIWYSVAVPPGEGVDETAHLDYVLFLKEHQRLPVEDPQHGQIEASMGHHPPLFYALGAGLIAPLDTSDRRQVLLSNPHFTWSESGKYGWNVILPTPRNHFPWSGTILALHLLRFLNIALGALTLLFVYLGVQALFPKQQWAPLGACALVGLNPAFLYMTSMVHHDALLVMLSSAGLYWAIRYATRAVTVGALVAIGVVMAACVLTKVSGIVLAPAVMLLLLLRPARRGDWKNRWMQILLAGGIAFLLCGWWFLRNQLVYGDPLGANVYRVIFRGNMRQIPFTWGLFVDEFLGQLGHTFWGAFGFMHILLPGWIEGTLWAICAVAIGGWLVTGAYWLMGRSATPVQMRGVWPALTLFSIALFGFYVVVAFSTLGAGHGRYLLPAAVVIGALLIGGLNGYGRWRYQQWIALALVVGMGIDAIAAPLYFVWPKYAIPASVAEAEVAQATPIHALYDGGVELIGVKSDSAVVIPGQNVEITTYWKLNDEPESGSPVPDIYVKMLLINDKPEVVANSDFWPEASTIPAVWGDRIIANRQRYYISPDQPAGNLLVQMEAKAGKGGESLRPLGAAAGEQVVTLLELVTLGAVVEVPPSLLPAEKRQEIFAKSLQLAAAPIPESVAAGDILPVVLYWRVLDAVPADYTIFVHVLNQAGEIVAQLDRPPGGGASPTSSWQAGQLLQDTYAVPLPDDLPPGEYQVRMGMYTWPDLTRQAIEMAGKPAGDSLILGEFSVADTAR